MGLPMWRESDARSNTQDKAKPDQASRHAQRRSSIRRQPSVRIPNIWRRSLGSPPPPPNPPHRDIPPIPRLDYTTSQTMPEPSRLRESIVSPPSPIPDPLPTEYRPRARRSATVEPPTALDEMPALRRMNHRSINDLPLPFDSLDALSTTADHLRDPSTRRSMSPSGDHWETLLSTITPDPSLPSAQSSFASAAASFSRTSRRSSPPLRGERRRGLQTGDLDAPSTVMNGPPTPMESMSENAWDRLFASERADMSRGNENADDAYCPNDNGEATAIDDAESRVRAVLDREHAQTYRHLLDHAHSFHHAYEHFDYFIAEFINAHSRRERTQSEADEVLRAMSDNTRTLLDSYDQQQRLRRERASPETEGRGQGGNDWEQLFHRVLAGGPEGPMSGAGLLSSLSNEALDARLHAAAMSENDTELTELRALVRERTVRGLRRNMRSR